jgi:hypothetical protein
MELPLQPWMEWLVAGLSTVVGAIAIKVIDRFQKP